LLTDRDTKGHAARGIEPGGGLAHSLLVPRLPILLVLERLPPELLMVDFAATVEVLKVGGSHAFQLMHGHTSRTPS